MQMEDAHFYPAGGGERSPLKWAEQLNFIPCFRRNADSTYSEKWRERERRRRRGGLSVVFISTSD